MVLRGDTELACVEGNLGLGVKGALGPGLEGNHGLEARVGDVAVQVGLPGCSDGGDAGVLRQSVRRTKRAQTKRETDKECDGQSVGRTKRETSSVRARERGALSRGFEGTEDNDRPRARCRIHSQE
eukprot:360647-Chlamydomonas_euryale.AAC.7